MLVQLGHHRLACLPFLRFVRQLGLLVGQRLCLRIVLRLRFRPLLPPLRFGFHPLRQLCFQRPP